jgi:hypothetical protein
VISGGIRQIGGGAGVISHIWTVESGPVPAKRGWYVSMNSDLGGAARQDFLLLRTANGSDHPQKGLHRLRWVRLDLGAVGCYRRGCGRHRDPRRSRSVGRHYPRPMTGIQVDRWDGGEGEARRAELARRLGRPQGSLRLLRFPSASSEIGYTNMRSFPLPAEDKRRHPDPPDRTPACGGDAPRATCRELAAVREA